MASWGTYTTKTRCEADCLDDPPGDDDDDPPGDDDDDDDIPSTPCGGGWCTNQAQCLASNCEWQGVNNWCQVAGDGCCECTSSPPPAPGPDTVPPNPAEVTARYDPGTHRVVFNWGWKGDRTCNGCERPVGFCQSNGTSFGPTVISCNPNEVGPYWWQIKNISRNVRTHYYYHGTSKNVNTGPGTESFSVSCDGREGDTFEIEVDTRDARGNIQGGPPYTNVRNASARCEFKPDTVPPNPPEVSAVYRASTHDILFSWEWKEDRTCAGCEGPVGYCDGVPGGTGRSTGPPHFSCDPTRVGPFWWQVKDIRNDDTLYYLYTGRNSNVNVDPGSKSFVVSCDGREGRSFRIDVDTRDARGNMAPGFANVKSATEFCRYKPDTVPPKPAIVSGEYIPSTHEIEFSWQWDGDRTCVGCEGPVEWCRSDNKKSAGSPHFSCEPDKVGPFWWKIENLTTRNREIYHYSGEDKTLPDLANYPPGGTRYRISCFGREGHTLRMDVDTRDARGNIQGGPPYTNVSRASVRCPRPGEIALSCEANTGSCSCTTDTRPVWSWDGATGAQDYDMYRSWHNFDGPCGTIGGCTFDTFGGSLRPAANEITQSDSYDLQAAAIFGGGNRSPRSDISRANIDITKNNPPRNLSVTQECSIRNNMYIQWDAPSNPAGKPGCFPKRYNVRVVTDGGFQDVWVSGTSHRYGPVGDGVDYVVRVRAADLEDGNYVNVSDWVETSGTFNCGGINPADLPTCEPPTFDPSLLVYSPRSTIKAKGSGESPSGGDVEYVDWRVNGGATVTPTTGEEVEVKLPNAQGVPVDVSYRVKDENGLYSSECFATVETSGGTVPTGDPLYCEIPKYGVQNENEHRIGSNTNIFMLDIDVDVEGQAVDIDGNPVSGANYNWRLSGSGTLDPTTGQIVEYKTPQEFGASNRIEYKATKAPGEAVCSRDIRTEDSFDIEGQIFEISVAGPVVNDNVLCNLAETGNPNLRSGVRTTLQDGTYKFSQADSDNNGDYSDMKLRVYEGSGGANRATVCLNDSQNRFSLLACDLNNDLKVEKSGDNCLTLEGSAGNPIVRGDDGELDIALKFNTNPYLAVHNGDVYAGSDITLKKPFVVNNYQFFTSNAPNDYGKKHGTVVAGGEITSAWGDGNTDFTIRQGVKEYDYALGDNAVVKAIATDIKRRHEAGGDLGNVVYVEQGQGQGPVQISSNDPIYDDKIVFVKGNVDLIPMDNDPVFNMYVLAEGDITMKQAVGCPNNNCTVIVNGGLAAGVFGASGSGGSGVITLEHSIQAASSADTVYREPSVIVELNPDYFMDDAFRLFHSASFKAREILE